MAVRGHHWHSGGPGEAATITRPNVEAAPSCHGIIVTALVIGVKELFEPLQKLKVVLKASFD